jgi:hypothetical protein
MPIEASRNDERPYLALSRISNLPLVQRAPDAGATVTCIRSWS